MKLPSAKVWQLARLNALGLGLLLCPVALSVALSVDSQHEVLSLKTDSGVARSTSGSSVTSQEAAVASHMPQSGHMEEHDPEDKKHAEAVAATRAKAKAARGHGEPEAHDEHDERDKHDEHEKELESEHGEHSEDAHGGGGDKEAHSVAIGLIATVIMIPLGISMATQEGRVQELTLKMVDTLISIFLAVLWFDTFSQFLTSFHLLKALPLGREAASLSLVVVLYIIANAIAFRWKDDDMRVTTFCSCSAHFIAFAGIAATGQFQAKTTAMVGSDWDSFAALFFVLAVAVALTLMFVANQYIWRGSYKHHALLTESIDELELDVVGLVISFLATQAMLVAVTGSYPAGHSFLQQGSSGRMHNSDTGWQTMFFVVYAAGLLLLARMAIPKLHDLTHHDPFMLKQVHVIKVILIMLIAWALLLGGQTKFYEWFKGDPMFGQMLFACGATMCCMLTLCLMGTYLAEDHPSPQTRQTFDIATTGISLVAAWSWEHCFQEAFEIVGQEYQVGYGGFVPKLVLSIILPCAMLPLYLGHVRPKVREIDEKYAEAAGGPDTDEEGAGATAEHEQAQEVP